MVARVGWIGLGWVGGVRFGQGEAVVSGYHHTSKRPEGVGARCTAARCASAHSPLHCSSSSAAGLSSYVFCPSAGCQSSRLPATFPGAPNFREVQGMRVFGGAIPTVAGMRAVLEHVGAGPESTPLNGRQVRCLGGGAELRWLGGCG